MQRIDTPNRILDKFGPGKDGFGDGVPATGTASTKLNAVAFDNYQEEIANAIELSGLTLNPNDMTQLWQAINARVAAAGPFVLRGGDTMTGQLTGTVLQAVNIQAYSANGTWGSSNIFFGADAGNLWQLSTEADGSSVMVWFEALPTPRSILGMRINPLGNTAFFGTQTTFCGTDLRVYYAPPVRAWEWNSLGYADVFYEAAIGPIAAGTRSWNGFGGVALMTLDASGFLNCQGNMQVSGPLGISYFWDTNSYGMAYDGSGPTILYFYVNGVLHSGSVPGTSDARIKNVTGDYTRGLTEVLALTPITYRFKGNDTAPAAVTGIAADAPPFRDLTYEHTGIVAQDVEAIIPEMVVKTKGYVDGVAVDDLRFLNPLPLTLALVNAVKELSARIVALETRGGLHA
jgi:hypothetical protein